MARGRKQTPEQIVGLLRQIEAGTANGKTAAIAGNACRIGRLDQALLLGADASRAAAAQKHSVSRPQKRVLVLHNWPQR